MPICPYAHMPICQYALSYSMTYTYIYTYTYTYRHAAAEQHSRTVVIDELYLTYNVFSLYALSYSLHILSGTPLQNNTVELWSLMNFIEPAKFPDLEKFQARFGNITTQEQVLLCTIYYILYTIILLYYYTTILLYYVPYTIYYVLYTPYLTPIPIPITHNP
jgi:hypothetical protein